MSNAKIELHIGDIAPSGSTTGAYAMVLSEVEGHRRLPIVIGGPEAQAIAIELEKMTPSRPLTHDLFRSLAHSFNIEVEEILIYNLVEGIFFSKLIVNQNGRIAEIDARTSDAVAIAVRFNCPIFCLEFILEMAGVSGIETDDDTEDDGELDLETIADDQTGNLSMDELQRMLDSALEQEDYEKASHIRDEINRRKAG